MPPSLSGGWAARPQEFLAKTQRHGGCCTSSAGLSFLSDYLGSLQTPAKVIGSIWFAVGIAYDALKTRGFRNSPVLTDFSEF